MMRPRAFPFDPVAPLAESTNPAIRFWARRDLSGERVGSVRTLWGLPGTTKLLRLQRTDGSWSYRSSRSGLRSVAQYDLLETYRAVGELVEKFGLNRRHPGLRLAAEHLLSSQSEEGDLRGIYGDQYTPNYTAAILELLIKAGYGEDPRVLASLDWLLRTRQEDGGWAIPFRTRGMNIRHLGPPTIEADPSEPFSHLVTGVVLRAFAAHPRYRRRAAVRHAGHLLASRMFMADSYPDRAGPEYWTRFSYPFWFTDLISALDSLSGIGYPLDDPGVVRALGWLVDRQRPDGLFDVQMLRTKDKDLRLWIALAICRVARRFHVGAR
jgi:hypothetical protein